MIKDLVDARGELFTIISDDFDDLSINRVENIYNIELNLIKKINDELQVYESENFNVIRLFLPHIGVRISYPNRKNNEYVSYYLFLGDTSIIFKNSIDEYWKFTEKIIPHVQQFLPYCNKFLSMIFSSTLFNRKWNECSLNFNRIIDEKSYLNYHSLRDVCNFSFVNSKDILPLQYNEYHQIFLSNIFMRFINYTITTSWDIFIDILFTSEMISKFDKNLCGKFYLDLVIEIFFANEFHRNIYRDILQSNNFGCCLNYKIFHWNTVMYFGIDNETQKYKYCIKGNDSDLIYGTKDLIDGNILILIRQNNQYDEFCNINLPNCTIVKTGMRTYEIQNW